MRLEEREGGGEGQGDYKLKNKTKTNYLQKNQTPSSDSVPTERVLRVEVAVLGSPSPIVRTVSVDVKQH